MPVAKPRVNAKLGAETVLVVDDEHALRSVLRIILEQEGFRVLEAEEGEQALAMLSSGGEHIDLILLDRSMPRMSGDQLLSALRERGMSQPVVLLTGHAGTESDFGGVSAVVLKPPGSGELIRTIRRVLDRV